MVIFHITGLGILFCQKKFFLRPNYIECKSKFINLLEREMARLQIELAGSRERVWRWGGYIGWETENLH